MADTNPPKPRRVIIKDTPLLKGLAAAILSLFLLLPVALVSDLVGEREQRMRDAEAQAAAGWGLQQELTGPVLVVPYRKTLQEYDEKGRLKSEKLVTYRAYFLPEELSIDGKMVPERRYRGIYEFVLYKSDLGVTGHFAAPDFSKVDVPRDDILWEDAVLLAGVSDPKGIDKELMLSWNGAPVVMGPGLSDGYLGRRTVTAPVKVRQGDGRYEFSLALALNGSSDFRLEPVGRVTRMALSSAWPDPSFSGAFLPDSREVDAEGFAAKWEVIDVNRDYPQHWTSETAGPLSLDSEFGVDFKLPVDRYQKTHRTLRYAIMFIGLTFLVFFLIEVMRDIRVHPIQYILVGLALVVFYSLLLSLTEHMPFTGAYVVAASATLGLVTFYTGAISRSRRIAALMGGVLALLYGFLFLNLQLQDYALLVGNVFLFCVLGAVMYVTRHVDWYAQGVPKEPKEEAASQPAAP